MELWNKFNLSILRHPKLRAFRAPARVKILEFVELSCRYDHKGVVSFLDDEIALDLGVSVHHWLTLRDGMIERSIVRQVRQNGSLVYEVAFWVLPDQSNPAGSIRDGRCLEPWDSMPAEAVDRFGGESVSGRDMRSARERTAERVALYRYRQRVREEENRYPSRQETAEFQAQYRAERSALPAEKNGHSPESSADERPDIDRFFSSNVTDSGQENVTDRVTVTLPVTSSLDQIGLESMRGDNNSLLETVTSAENVTALQNVTDVTPVTSAEENNAEMPSATEFVPYPKEEEKAVVVALLSEAGKEYALSVSVAEDLVRKYGAAHCRKQLEWLMLRGPLKKGATLAGRLRDSIQKDWAEPPAAREMARSQAERAQEQERRAAIQQRAEAARQAGRDHQRRREAFWEQLTPEERAEIDRRAGAQLPTYHREKWHTAQANGTPLPKMVLVALEEERWKIVDGILPEREGENDAHT